MGFSDRGEGEHQPGSTRALLIGGTSHSGKSTLAALLAAELGWTCVATDHLGRHPGRPWPAPSDDVAVHYRSLSAADLADAQWRHYEHMWPDIEHLLARHLAEPAAAGLVFEGSGVLPSGVASLPRNEQVAALWLTGPRSMFAERIYRAGRYEQADEERKFVIDQFLGRTLRYDERMRAEVRGHALPLLGTGDRTPTQLAEQVLRETASRS